jgi:ATP-dependent DNA helicase RecQ
MDGLSTYGIMPDISARRIIHIMDFLIENNYICQTLDEYPVVQLSERSNEIVKDRTPVQMKLPLERKEDKKAAAKTKVDSELLIKLKELRSKLAAKERVPAYIVFSDAALHDMCRKLPQNNDEFLDVSGVGKAKMEKYGRQFIGLICNYYRLRIAVPSNVCPETFSYSPSRN